MEPKEKLIWSLVLLPITYSLLVGVHGNLEKYVPLTTMTIEKLFYITIFTSLVYMVVYLCNSIVVNAVKLAKVKELNTINYRKIDGLTCKIVAL